MTLTAREVSIAGHTGDLATARAGWQSPDPDVRVVALGALERLGEADDVLLTAALRDDEVVVRHRAATMAAKVPDVDLLGALTDVPLVAEAAAWSCGEQFDADRGRPRVVVTSERFERYERVLGALIDLASNHSDRLVREAAIAGIGAIGDPRGLGAVLGGLDDKPAIRRRAVVALAAFEGPEVEAAIERARSDRDWQVRQVIDAIYGAESSGSAEMDSTDARSTSAEPETG